jgi:hypothetical protein
VGTHLGGLRYWLVGSLDDVLMAQLRPAREDDTLTVAGATKLAADIEAYWRAKGFKQIRCIIKPISQYGNPATSNRGPGGDPVNYAIRSNMVRGYPPK